MNMQGVLVALISGILMSVQGVFNTEVTKQSSLWVATGFVQLTALLVCIAAWFVKEGTGIGAVLQVHPWYYLLGGVMGAFITITVVKSVASLGPARSALLIVTAQMAASYLIEVFGWFGVDRQAFSLRRLLGLLISALGIMIFKWE